MVKIILIEVSAPIVIAIPSKKERLLPYNEI
jgi:hypothetical protein